jgi:hypothetical protein
MLDSPSALHQKHNSIDPNHSVPNEGSSAQPTTKPVLDTTPTDLESPYTLKSIHDNALRRLEATGISPDDYKKAESKSLQNTFDSVTEAISQHNDLQGTGIADKFRPVLNSLLERLGKFETAIDMLAQSMPQVMGLSLVGIIWGSIKVLLVVSQ